MSAHDIDDYLAALDPQKRSTLAALRRSILAVVPDAEEGLSYGVPAFRLDGQLVAGFSAATHHLSYLPHSGTVLADLGGALSGYRASKGALTFAVDRPLPDGLVEQLIRGRLRELGRRPS